MNEQALTKLIPAQYGGVLPLFEDYIRDPLMYAVLDGLRPGRVYADNPQAPRFAVVWTDTECLYVGGAVDEPPHAQALVNLIGEKLMPLGKILGLEFLSLFSTPGSAAVALEAPLAHLEPLRTPANTFLFNRSRYRGLRAELRSVPEGFTLQRLDEKLLFDPANEALLDSVTHYWGTVPAFLSHAPGYALLKETQIVSWLYVQAIGGGGQAPDAWTDPELRGLGLAAVIGARWIEDCLMQGQTPFWLNDEANQASRRLAENLGFDFTGNIDLIDIPFYPFEFYRDLARHFFLVHDSYRNAALAFERAFRLGPGEPMDYYLAAACWMHADEPVRALDILHDAIDHGLEDLLILDGTEAFEMLQGTQEWEALKQYYLTTRRNN
ncbi:MAG: GNAT family N-acetyltransferase [Anaerolineales bacterium]|jgi:hypothetical protein